LEHLQPFSVVNFGRLLRESMKFGFGMNAPRLTADKLQLTDAHQAAEDLPQRVGK
jgi:hypothetical protein